MECTQWSATRGAVISVSVPRSWEFQVVAGKRGREGEGRRRRRKREKVRGK
jgi:hypothetical protein